MGAKSEFQTIFEKVLERESGFSQAEEAPHPKSGGLGDDLVSKIFFGSSKLRAQIFADLKKAYGAPKVLSAADRMKAESAKGESTKGERSEPAKMKVAPLCDEFTEPQPTPRVKRKFTIDQQRAIAVFVKYGENLDEYSTDQEIKSAYRRLAKKYHPDSGAKSSDQFKQIAAAYRIAIPSPSLTKVSRF